MADPWRIAGVVISFLALLPPFFVFLCNKLFAYLSIDVEQKLNELEIKTIPDLKNTLMRVQEQMMLRAAKRKRSESTLNVLEKTAKGLKSKLHDAEDILDLIDYHRIEKKVIGDRIIWVQRLREVARACKGSWFGRCTDIIRDARLRCKQILWDNPLLVQLCRWASPSATPDPEAPGNPEEPQTSSQVQRLYAWFCGIYNCCGAILCCPPNMVIAVYSIYWNRSCEVLGIKHNKKDGIGLDSFQLMIHGKSLRERMEQIDSVLTLAKELPLLNEQSSSSELSVNDTDKIKSSSSNPFEQDKDKESRSKRKEIDDMHRKIAQPVFGREKDQMLVSDLLRKEPSSRYSVIGIHGIAGSGKTTLARYVCDYEKETKNKYFDCIMFIQLSKTFRLRDIFTDMLMEIFGQDHESLESQREELKNKLNGKCLDSLCLELKEKLKGKCFLLVLDDLWVDDKNKERDLLLDALAAGDSRSRILVTAQAKDAAAALGACQQILIPDLDENLYFSLFMHHALRDRGDVDEKYRRVGIRIVKKLHKSPIAAVTVAKQLQRNRRIDFWETTAELDVLNETMGALWWSYKQLGPEIRRCFEYCSIFPRGYELRRDDVVNLWMAQGFLKLSNATEEPEDVGQSYFEELLTLSFFQVYEDPSSGKQFTIHDLLHELAERVAGSDFFKIGLNCLGCSQVIPPEVHHLFVETYERSETTVERILELENLRTLIIEERYCPHEDRTFDSIRTRDAEERHPLVKEKLVEGVFKKMRKLRVLIVRVKIKQNVAFSVPESICEMKHLRLLAFHLYFYCSNNSTMMMVDLRPSRWKLIFPSTFSKLYHLQTLHVSNFNVSYPEDMANLIHLRSITEPFFPKVGQLTSLQLMESFEVRKKHGYELKQLMHLNKLRGYLSIGGLENVGSKDEALEGNLAGKTSLTGLSLAFDHRKQVAKDVLEGLVPPKDLEKLDLWNYTGSWYPSWMLSRQNPDAPRNLHKLSLNRCSPLAYIPEDSDFFASLRLLRIVLCTWDALPDHMERLTSLKELQIYDCENIELLPTTLPKSLENIRISGVNKNKLWTSFQDETHVNWQRIKHIPCKEIYPPVPN